MKSILMTAGIVGVALAGALYYFSKGKVGENQIINVEDGMPVTT